MENASKALLMAAGMLIAILLISVGAFVYSKVKSLKTTEAEITAQKQVQAFNAEYESYNRRLLRGIDVISVVNKAISNNERQDPINDSDPCYVNIKIIKTSTFDHSGYKVDIRGNKEGCTDAELAGKVGNTLPNISSLGEYDGTTEQWIPNSNMVNYFNQNLKTVIYKTGDYTYHITPSLVQFKSAVFECTEVIYNDDGRVKQMTFKEK